MTRILFSLAALCLLTAPIVTADEPATANKQCCTKDSCTKDCCSKESCTKDCSTKGLSAGDDVGAFLVTKVAGAKDDNVDNGDSLCYRCKYGQRPMVIVFTRVTDGSVPKLVEQLDAAVAKHSKNQLKGFVTLIGKEQKELTSEGQAMASKLGDKNIPIVVAKDSENGPSNYKLDANTAVTVVLVNHSQVVARHNFAADKVDVAAVMKQVNEMLN